MSENSTPVNTPASGTVNAEELVMSEDFMNDIMGSLAPGEKAKENIREISQENVQNESAEKNNEIKEIQEAKEESSQEDNQENTGKEEGTKVQEDVLEKRFKDSQAMIGRQSNELGQLRKQVAEMQNLMEADRKKTGQDSTPYYEKLLSNNPDTLAEKLNITREQVETLQLAARMAKDVAKDMVKPFEQLAQETALQKEIASKDVSWYADHPDYKNRQPIMAKFLNKIFPNGPAAQGADPWQAAHMAYEHAGEVMASVQQNATQQNDKRIINARSAEGSTKSIDGSAALKPQNKPMDAKTAEIYKVFDAQAAQLVRSRG